MGFDSLVSERPSASAEPDAGRSPWNPLAAAALAGGALAATAGAYVGTRALVRRNRAEDGKPVSSVMATAITASDLAASQAQSEPPAPVEPPLRPL